MADRSAGAPQAGEYRFVQPFEAADSVPLSIDGKQLDRLPAADLTPGVGEVRRD